MCGMFNIYLDGPTKIIKKWFQDNHLLSCLSPAELKLIQKPEQEITSQEMCDISWYVESLCALMWAGSIFDTLSPQKHVPDTQVNFVPNVEHGESPENFIKSIKLRPYGQLYKMRDLYYGFFMRKER